MTSQTATVPLVYRRRVQWGDGDAAGIAYTARFFDFGMEAIDAFFERVLGNNWLVMNRDRKVGSPFVHLEMDIQSPLLPGEDVLVSVLVEGTGRSTIRFRLKGAKDDGTPVFNALFVCSMVDNQIMRAIPIPDDYMARIEAYRAGCGEAS